MKPYSQDLRQRVLAQVQAGEQTQAAIATTFKVSLSTVEKWLRRKRATGKTTPLPPAHGPTRALKDCATIIRAAVKSQPDLTLQELCAHVAQSAKVTVSPSTMCRALHQLNLPRKKRRSTIANGTHRASNASAASSRNGSQRNGSRIYVA